MRTWFCFGFIMLTLSLSSIGCERASYKESREESERYGDIDDRPDRSTLEEELGE